MSPPACWLCLFSGPVKTTAAQNAQQNNDQAQANLKAQQQQAQLLDQVLTAWFNSSKNIQKLEGEHRRFVFDFVFNVENRPPDGSTTRLPTKAAST